jgi:hypothetical protein
VVKWGALAELLGQEGEGQDLGRAAYCEARYQQGVELTRISPSVAQAAIGDVTLIPQAIVDWDSLIPSWQNGTGIVRDLAFAGYNLMATRSVPDGAYGISLDVIRNAPVPSAEGDFIQVGRENLGAILDLAQHLAAFKQGGAEFTESAHLYQNFMEAAGIYNERLRSTSFYLATIQGQTLREAKLRTRRDTDSQVSS